MKTTARSSSSISVRLELPEDYQFDYTDRWSKWTFRIDTLRVDGDPTADQRLRTVGLHGRRLKKDGTLGARSSAYLIGRFEVLSEDLQAVLRARYAEAVDEFADRVAIARTQVER